MNYLDILNKPQKEAVTHYGNPLLILAGAGSGKTRVITTKIAYLIDKMGVDPYSILAVTFTNKAAGEMRERSSALVYSAGDVMIRTFHSFGAWLLRRNAAAAGCANNFSIYDDEDALSLLQAIFPDLGKSVLRRYNRLISRAKDYCLTPEDELEIITRDNRLPEIYAEYQSRLNEIGNADFGDLIMRPIYLLRNNPEIRQRITERFTTILVDEYQDSNVAQHMLLQELCGEKTYLCVVGDDDQSIYRFRGAEVRNILEFADHFPGTDIIRLEENYRSTGAILDFASRVVSLNTGRLGKTLWTGKPMGSKPTTAFLADQDEETAFCVEIISGLSPEALNETAILYRTNAQSRSLETAFLRRGIPYRIVGTARFYEREEIRDGVAFLKLLSNPMDEVAFRRIINKPARGIGKKSCEKILDGNTGRDLIAAAKEETGNLKGKSKRGLEEFLSIVDEIKAGFKGGQLSGFVERVITVSGLAGYHQEQDEVSGTQKIRNLEELVNAASLYEASPEGLSEFLETIELDRIREEDQNGEGGRVTLITMHNTKGLEFDRVIITGMDEGIFPSLRRNQEDDPDEYHEKLEEERRLFYVAATRARQELYMTSCKYRKVYGRLERFEPSRFLSEIPKKYYQIFSQKTPKWGSTLTETGQDPEEDGFVRGTWVYHDDYGKGIIIERKKTGPKASVVVQFETGKKAKFIPEYSGLEKISYDS
ncbi:MAG: ATP-dependent helicase [Spirochaetia bacterium]